MDKIIISFIDIAMMLLLSAMVCDSKKCLEVVAEGLFFFFSMYVILSGVLFWLDIFTIGRVLAAQGIFEIIFVVFALKYRGLRLDIKNFNRLELDLIPALLILMALVLTSVKFELFGAGQDQGLYQAEAIAIAKGDYRIQHDYPEYQMLDSEEDKTAYREMVSKWLGYYLLSDAVMYPTVEETDVMSEVSGVYHGIVTWPALMAWFASLFGMENMYYIQSVFLACSIALLYYAMEYVGIRNAIKIIVSLILVASPLVIWTAKSSLTEMFLVLCMTDYLYVLAKKKIEKIFLGVPLVAFAWYHVSFLILVPAFFAVHAIAYVLQKDKGYLYANFLMVIGLISGYNMMAATAAHYFFDNLNRLYFGPIDCDNIMFFIMLGGISILLISFILTFEKIQEFIDMILKWKKLPLFFTLITGGCIVSCLYHAYHVGYLSEPNEAWNARICSYYGTGAAAFGHMTLYAFMLATGVVIIPVTLVLTIKNDWWLYKRDGNDNIGFLLAILVLYMVYLQSAFLRKEVYHYYYYCRYLVFYIPLICLYGAVCINDCKQWVLNGIIIVSLLCMLPFDRGLILGKDDTKMEWETMQDLTLAVEGHSAIIVDKSLQLECGPNIKAMTSADVYPVFSDVRTELNNLDEKYDHVYYLTENADKVYESLDKVLVAGDGTFDKEYSDVYECSIAGDKPEEVMFPLSFTPIQKRVALYKYHSDGFVISANNNMASVRNAICYDGYVESSGEEGVVLYGPYIFLSQGKYRLCVPVEFLTSDSIPVSYMVYRNGDEIYAQGTVQNALQYKDKKNRQVAVIDFELEEDKDNIEFLVKEERGTKLRIYDYSLKKLQ